MKDKFFIVFVRFISGKVDDEVFTGPRRKVTIKFVIVSVRLISPKAAVDGFTGLR